VNIKRWLLGLLSLILLTANAGPALAQPADYQSAAQLITISAGETLSGPVFLSGQKLEIAGTIDGDLYVWGQDIRIRGLVTGDVLAAGQIINLEGLVQGNVRAAAQTISLQNEVQGSATFACQDLSTSPTSRIGRDLVFACNTSSFSGTIGRTLYGAAGTASISGTVGGDVRLPSIGTLNLQPGSTINGNLIYASASQATISPQATVRGQSMWTPQTTTPPVSAPEIKTNYWGINLIGFIYSLVSLLLIWLIVWLIFPRGWRYLAEPAVEEPLSRFGLGLLLLLATPVLLVLLLATIIGIPLALLLGFVYALLLFISKLVAAEALVAWFEQKTRIARPYFLLLLISLLLILAAVQLPYIGWIISLMIMAIALGSIWKAMLRGGKPPAPASIETVEPDAPVLTSPAQTE